LTVLDRLRSFWSDTDDGEDRGVPPSEVLAGTPEADALAALETVMDPEVGINVVDLGLVYGIRIDADVIHVTMTMTTPACPLGGVIKARAVEALEGALPHLSARVRLVWSPSWSPRFITARGRDWLGY
jgi:metal-sulfur cluster biosynthetic enzyme